jgi:hypothetical protein
MTGFYGQLPLGQSPSLMGANEGVCAQNTYGQGLPMMLPAEGLAQALQTTSSMPQPMNSSDPSASIQFKPPYPVTGGVSLYARGGRVQREQSQTDPSQTEKPLWGLAETLRKQGEEGDSILAHISPREAAFLAEHFGGDINPETGLPQFGWFSKIWKGVKKVAGPALGAVLGTMVGGPIGGAIGGGIGGSFGHPNDRAGPVMGGIGGYFGGPALLQGGKALMAGQGLSGLGAGLSSGFGQSTGMLSNGLSSLGNATGLGSFFGGGGGSAAASTPFSMNPVSHLASTLAGKGASPAVGGGLGSFFGGNMLNNALLATAIGGTLLRREKPQGPQSIGDAMREAEKHRWRPDQYPDKNPAKSINRKYKAHSNNYRPGFDPEEEAFEEDSPWQYTPRFSEGGFLEGESPGQQDNVPALLSEGEYVIPADVVSDLGDGNSKAGAKRLSQLILDIRRHKNTDQHPPKAKGLGAYLNA